MHFPICPVKLSLRGGHQLVFIEGVSSKFLPSLYYNRQQAIETLLHTVTEFFCDSKTKIEQKQPQRNNWMRMKGIVSREFYQLFCLNYAKIIMVHTLAHKMTFQQHWTERRLTSLSTVWAAEHNQWFLVDCSQITLSNFPIFPKQKIFFRSFHDLV